MFIYFFPTHITKKKEGLQQLFSTEWIRNEQLQPLEFI